MTNPRSSPVTDAMVERAWAAIVGRDIAPQCFNASIIRGDLRTALEAVIGPAQTGRDLSWKLEADALSVDVVRLEAEVERLRGFAQTATREALEEINALISNGDRPTVNERNAFEHFTVLNRLLLNIRDIARRVLSSVPSTHQREQGDAPDEISRLRAVAWAAQGLLNADTYVSDVPREQAVREADLKLRQALGTWQRHHTAALALSSNVREGK